MACCGTCARLLLILFTAIFSIIGLLLIVAGLLVKFGSDTFLKPYFDKLFQSISSITGSYQKSNSGSNTSDPNQPLSGEADLLFTIFVTCVSTGSILAFISIIGFVGSCFKSKCLLYIYALIIALIGIAIIVLTSLLLTGTLNSLIQKQLLLSITYGYYGLEYNNTDSVAWNYIMIKFGCCGVNDYRDFNNSEHWNRQIKDGNNTYYLVTPVACCRMNGTFPDVVPYDQQCAIAPNENISNFRTGCWDEVTQRISSWKVYAGLIVTGVLVIMAFILFWSCVVGNGVNQVQPI